LRKRSPFITPDSQIVVYDTHITGLIFIRASTDPFGLFISRKTTLMGSPYVSIHQPTAPTRKALQI
jgi:hypothetical protein